MSTSVVKFYPKRVLTDAQKRRLKQHEASVQVGTDGALRTNVRTIITPAGLTKEISYKTVKPGQNERVIHIKEVPELFHELKHINLIVTNACNLSCSYCYEQHSVDYGRFTSESLRQVYDFLLNCNDEDGKRFQFFGGEPLIHKKLILEFIEKNEEHLRNNMMRQRVSMITNGILLSPEFIAEYFKHEFVNMSISLDTDLAEIDHREIGQSKINHIMDMISLIPTFHKSSHMVSIRCTIAVENAKRLREFATNLYARGMRMMVIHPLTMSSVNGFMNWPDDVWSKLQDDISDLIKNYPDFDIQFSEGVGVRGGSNCMVGSDMIAVDGSGDYSGCYFFTNQKESAAHAILGNLLTGDVFVDRYASFQEAYDNMFTTEEQCKTCDLQGFCYQCPAGNLDSGDGRMFRPDDMCQDIVRLFITLQNDITKKSFMRKLQEIANAVAEQGEQRVFAKALIHLLYYQVNNQHIQSAEVDAVIDYLPDYKLIATQVASSITQPNYTVAPLMQYITSYDPNSCYRIMSVREAYEIIMEHKGRPIQASKNSGDVDDLNKRIFYLTLLHMVLLNKKGDTLDNKPRRHIAG